MSNCFLVFTAIIMSSLGGNVIGIGFIFALQVRLTLSVVCIDCLSVA